MVKKNAKNNFVLDFCEIKLQLNIVFYKLIKYTLKNRRRVRYIPHQSENKVANNFIV